MNKCLQPRRRGKAAVRAATSNLNGRSAQTAHRLGSMALTFFALTIFGCGRETNAPPPVAAEMATTAEPAWFSEVGTKIGVTFEHYDGRSGQKFYVESAASGGGWIDYDRDGDPDLYLLNGAMTPGSVALPGGPPRNALYENRDGRFVEVTDQSGTGDTGYGMGLCVGDIDGDGWPDLFITNYGQDRLFRNLGDGTFAEIAQLAGVADSRWGTGCAFGDVDGDGDLDLYVAHYVDFKYDQNPYCGDKARGLRAFCRPDVFDGVPDSLFINRGDGTFSEEGAARGLAQGKDEKGFGVVFSDLDDDGDLDIYVANDTTMNRLYINDGKGYFTDYSLMSGTGFSESGLAQSGMGVELADFDGDRMTDIFVTNYSMETNTLYLNRGGLFFEDRTQDLGLGAPSYQWVGWGVVAFDFDNDGDSDIGVANGHVMDNIESFEPDLRYRQKNQLFRNDGGTFVQVGAHAGPAWSVEKVSRAMAFADWDSDGRLDLLVTNTNDRPDLLRNEIITDHHWIGLRLAGSPQNPLAIGARVTLWLEDGLAGVSAEVNSGRAVTKEVRSGGSFLAQSDLRLHFGLGQIQAPIRGLIRWPDGRLQTLSIQKLDRYLDIAYNPD